MAFPSDLVRTKNWGTEVLTDSDLEGQFDLIINWVMAALNATTGHAHDGTSNQGPKLSSSGVTTTFGNGFTTVTGTSSDYLLIASDVSDSNSTKKALASDFTFTPSASNALAGSVVQYKRSSIATVVTCSTNIPDDDTIPQNTEGTEVTTVSITPTNSSNLLVIKAYFSGTGSGNSATITAGAFFQDSTANAIYASFTEGSVLNEKKSHTMNYVMAAGTTSSTTFKLRVGSQADTFYVNGNNSGTRLLGGVSSAWIEVWEIKV